MAKGSGGDRNIASARSSQLDDADTPSVQASARPMRRETVRGSIESQRGNDEVEQGDSDSDSDSELALESEEAHLVPFPRQKDPSKPLRPNGYASRRALSGLRSSIAGKEGLLLIGTAQLLYSTMALFFKLLHDLPEGRENPISALEVIFIRMGITYIGCVSYMVLSSTPHPFLGPPEVRWLLLLRGAVGFVGLGSFYYSLQYLSLSDATVITFLSPFATSWLAWAVLGESFSTRQTLAGMASLAGVVLIARPSFLFGKLADDELEMPVGDEALRALQILHASTSSSSSAQSVLASSTSTSTASIASATIAVLRSTSDQARRAALGALVGFLQGRDERSSHAASSLTPRDEISEEQRLLAVFVALAGVLGSSGAYCTIRAIGHRATATHSVAAFSGAATVVSGLWMFCSGVEFVLPPGLAWCAMLLAIGIFGLGAQVLAAMGLQREKAGRATSMVYTQAIWSTVYQLLILGTPMQPLSLAGCAIILAAAAWVAIGN